MVLTKLWLLYRYCGCSREEKAKNHQECRRRRSVQGQVVSLDRVMRETSLEVQGEEGEAVQVAGGRTF